MRDFVPLLPLRGMYKADCMSALYSSAFYGFERMDLFEFYVKWNWYISWAVIINDILELSIKLFYCFYCSTFHIAIHSKHDILYRAVMTWIRFLTNKWHHISLLHGSARGCHLWLLWKNTERSLRCARIFAMVHLVAFVVAMVIPKPRIPNVLVLVRHDELEIKHLNGLWAIGQMHWFML